MKATPIIRSNEANNQVNEPKDFNSSVTPIKQLRKDTDDNF